MSSYMTVENVIVTLNNHEYYHSKSDLEESIRDDEKMIESYKKKIFGMCCGNARDLFGDKTEGGETVPPIDLMLEEYDRLMAEMLTINAHLVDKYYVLEHFDKAYMG